ncbi:MAG: hypothetical protein RL196_1330 [Actinomycetota bacterium]
MVKLDFVTNEKTTTNLGAGRLLIAVYGVFALAASGRASFELITKFDLAPFSYSLSAVSALIYVLVAFALASKRPIAAQVAKIALWFELVGVVSVGTLGFFIPELGNFHTVWWFYGAAYACLPLVLPIFGLFYLNRKQKGTVD